MGFVLLAAPECDWFITQLPSCGFAGVPLEKALGFLPTKSLANLPLAGAAFVPPTSVQGIAKAAVAAATDPAVPGGVMDVWQLQQYDKQ